MKLKKPLYLRLSVNEGVYTLENPDLGIIGFGNDLNECLRSAPQELTFLWKNYGISDVPMTDGAKQLKGFMLDYFEE